MEIGNLIRLGPWFGRIIDILESTTTGEKFARVKLVKHQAGITEIHPVADLAPATVEQVQQTMNAVRARQAKPWLEILARGGEREQ
jgi:hypothetical protein